MKTSRRGARFRDGEGSTVKKGKLNKNSQRCCGTLDVPGTDKNALAYKMECTLCGFVYGANGGDVFERKCPNCQGGAPGIRFWLIARKVPADGDGANGTTKGTRVEYDTVETGADWLERHSGSMKDVPDSVYDGFLEYSRLAREEMNRLPVDGDEPRGSCSIRTTLASFSAGLSPIIRTSRHAF
jgi:hypothetical protein